MRRQLDSARHGFQRLRARGFGILTRFVSLILVRSRCGDSSTPQDTDFNDCVHEELDIDEVVSLILVRSRCGDSSTPQDTDFNDCVHEELDIDEVVSLILVRSRCGDSSTPQDTVGNDVFPRPTDCEMPVDVASERNVSTDKADTSSAIVQLVEEIDKSAPQNAGYEEDTDDVFLRQSVESNALLSFSANRW